MGVIQKKRMASLFDQADFDIRQQRQQFTGRLGRHQAIEPGKQVQLWPAIGLQGLAGIQLCQHLEPTQQHLGTAARSPAREQARLPARVSRTLGAQQAETLEGGLGLLAAAVEELFEGLARHGTGPAGTGHETRVARQRQQPAAAIATARRQLRSEHTAQRPAAQPGVFRQRRVQFLDPLRQFATGKVRKAAAKGSNGEMPRPQPGNRIRRSRMRWLQRFMGPQPSGTLCQRV